MSVSGKLAAMAVFTAVVLSPVSAQTMKAAEWWLVLDDGDMPVARFVDMGSVTRSDRQMSVATMTVDRAGSHNMQRLSVDCERMFGSSGDPQVKRFVCGSAEYRNNNGLILGPVSPDEMASMMFVTKAAYAKVGGSVIG